MIIKLYKYNVLVYIKEKCDVTRLLKLLNHFCLFCYQLQIINAYVYLLFSSPIYENLYGLHFNPWKYPFGQSNKRVPTKAKRYMGREYLQMSITSIKSASFFFSRMVYVRSIRILSQLKETKQYLSSMCKS